MRVLVTTLTLACVVLLVAGGCAPSVKPVVVSREALGTVVSVTAYGAEEAAVREAIEAAFAAMAEVESDLDAYTPGTAIARFNEHPYEEQPLPQSAVLVLDEIEVLGVERYFSPALLGVSRLYGFDATQTVPGASDLLAASDAARSFHRSGASAGFSVPPDGTSPAPGLDFGGASKGLALDSAREALRASGAVDAAVITAGSTTVTLGSKPTGGTWQIGVEDPRSPDHVVAVFELTGDGAVSTSGDYQLFFERDGVRYHHILDPATGQPARGLRSLAIGGSTLTGLDSDILSTALFVAGAEDAAEYARSLGASLYTVDASGGSLLVASDSAAVREVATPTR
jgi:thiamine biosynthesis lipoprotein